MKSLLISLFLCMLVSTSTAQVTKSPAIRQMQMAVGKMLMQMRDLSVANIAFSQDTEDQNTLNTLYDASELLYQLFPAFSTSNTSSLPLVLRDRVNKAMTSLKNNLTAWESAMDMRDAEELLRTFKDVENSFLGLGGIVFSM